MTKTTTTASNTAQLEAARAEAAAIKARRTKGEKTEVAKAIPHDSKAAAGDTDLFEHVQKRYFEAQDAMLAFFKAPTWKRSLCALATALLVGAGVGYVAGTVLNWVVAGALLFAVPTFIILIVYAIGVALAIWYGGKWAARAAGAVLTGEADERAIAAYDATKNFAKRFNPFAKVEFVKAKEA